MSRETDRTTAEHETASVADVWEMESQLAALDSMLREAGLTEGTVVERVERLLASRPGETPAAVEVAEPSKSYDRLSEQNRQIAEGIIRTYRDPNWRSR